MKPIVIALTPEEAENIVQLVDLALKHPNGGVLALKAANAIVDKINAAVQCANKLEAET
jgi:hypothetical protein